MEEKIKTRKQKNLESAKKSRDNAKAYRIELEKKVNDLMKKQKELE